MRKIKRTRKSKSVALQLVPRRKRPLNGNAFDILGVAPNASGREIKRAYIRLARGYHPDINPSPKARSAFIIVTRAYEEFMKQGDYAKLKLICDVVEAKVAHVEFLRLLIRIKLFAGIDIPPVSPADMARRRDDGKAARLRFALIFRCPFCKRKKECDRATGFDAVAGFHNEFMAKVVNH